MFHGIRSYLLRLSSPHTVLICPVELICDVCVSRRAAEAHFEPDPLIRLSFDADRDGCSAGLALDRARGFVSRCYPDADIFRCA